MPNCPYGQAQATQRIDSSTVCYHIDYPSKPSVLLNHASYYINCEHPILTCLVHSVKPYTCSLSRRSARRGLVERFEDVETTPEQCRSPDTVAFIDDDGMEVIAEIPEGKVEEYVEYVRLNDVAELKKLKVNERRERNIGRSHRLVSA
jgi:hypothetical protein